MSRNIVVVGSCMIDLTSYASDLPKPGETLTGTKFEIGFGGKGANQCVAAARLGASTTLIASLGNDTFGQEYLLKLKQENINTSYLKIQENVRSGVAQITVAKHGANTIVIVPGANSLLSPEDIIAASDCIQAASVLLFQFETPIATTLQALKIYKGKGISIVNAAPALKEVDPDIFKLCDIFCVNEIEASMITGIEMVTVSNAQEAVDKLFLLGCNTIIITLGESGVIYATSNNKKINLVHADKVKAVDTCGAGDAFLGVLAYYQAYHSYLSLDECISRSCKIATQSVLKAGTQSSYPYKKDLPDSLFV